jgi:hypothetical protein
MRTPCWHDALPTAQEPATPHSQRLLAAVFGLWLVAFALKHAGASWDVAWHYRFLRDDLIPPHMVNLMGNALALALLYGQIRTGMALEWGGMALLAAGFGMFVLALPLDLLNHRLFGLDVTIWSVPHLMFFAGSTLALGGILRMWLRLAAPGWLRSAYTLALLTLLMDCALFVLGQFEYGVLSLDAFRRGQPTASDSLLALARGDVARFATGGAPAWVYPVWMVLGGSLVLIGARRALPGRWTATTVAALYLAYRMLALALLAWAGFPPSFIPLMLLGAGLAIDLAERWRWRPAATALALLLAFYGGAALLGRLELMPGYAPITAGVVAAPLWLLVTAARKNQGPRATR